MEGLGLYKFGERRNEKERAINLILAYPRKMTEGKTTSQEAGVKPWHSPAAKESEEDRSVHHWGGKRGIRDREKNCWVNTE